jgi:Zn-dependent peptidase ImmA (M78 family)
MNPSVITQLRDLVPIRPLTRLEALKIAELQAIRFRELVGALDPSLPEEAISGLPRVQVERTWAPAMVDAVTQWSHGRWLVALNNAKPAVRQRFSLAHELKHILDDRFIRIIYNGVADPRERHDWIELVCHHFAACLLMPRPLIKQHFYSGVQRTADLALLFDVSQEAMQRRLQDLQLVDPVARCGYLDPDWSLQAIKAAGSSDQYFRLASLVNA